MRIPQSYRCYDDEVEGCELPFLNGEIPLFFFVSTQLA